MSLPLLQDSAFKDEEAIHIAYLLCSHRRQDEFLASLSSLHLFAETALKSEPAYYHIHVIADDVVRPPEGALDSALGLSASLYIKASHFPPVQSFLHILAGLKDVHAQKYAPPRRLSIPWVMLQVGTEEMAVLKPHSNFRLTLHQEHPGVPELFAPCAMQVLYLHEREDFKDVHQASIAMQLPHAQAQLR